MSKINLYLGGCISYYHVNNKYHKATTWREKIISKILDLNAECMQDKFDWFNPTVNFYKNVKTANVKTVVDQNNYYLNKCDILIVSLDDIDKSPGTLYELFYFGIHNKPVIAFGSNTFESSPHIQECITVQADTLDDVIKYLANYYNQ